MSEQQPPVQQAGAQTPEQEPLAIPPPSEDAWDAPLGLPPRPRRRLLEPLPLALLGVLLLACGFIGGVLVEKGQGSGSPAAAAGGGSSGLASRLAALRATGGGGSAAPVQGSGGASALGGGRPTAGQVAYLSGKTLYVTTAEGNTLKVETSPSTSVTKTVKSSLDAIHPGETVTVAGQSGSNGAISAETIRVGGGALTGLFGGSGSGGTSGGTKGAGEGGGGAPQLFGPG